MSEAELNRAKQDVEMSTKEIDRAMNHLEERIDGTAQNVKRAAEKVREFARSAGNLVNRGRNTFSSAMHRAQYHGQAFLSKAKSGSMQTASRVKSNPAPYIAAGTAAVLFLSAIMMLRRGRRSELKSATPNIASDELTLFDRVA